MQSVASSQGLIAAPVRVRPGVVKRIAPAIPKWKGASVLGRFWPHLEDFDGEGGVGVAPVIERGGVTSEHFSDH